MKNSNPCLRPMLLLVACLSGCAGTAKLPSEEQAAGKAAISDWQSVQVQFDAEALNAVSVSQVRVAYDSSAGAAGVAAAQHSAAYQPGYNPAIGAAGGIIGVLVVNEFQQSSQNRQLNKPLQPLNEWLAGTSEPLMTAHAWQAALERSGLFQAVWPAASPSTRPVDGTINFTPQVGMLAGYSVLHVQMAAEFITAEGAKSYENVYHYLSPSVGPSGDDAAAVWLDDGGVRLQATVAQALPLLADQILADLGSPRLWLTAAETVPIRYTIGDLTFYERGHVMAGPADNRLTYRSLDGSVKTVSFDQLETPHP